MNTKNLVKGAMGAVASGAGLYAGKMIRAKVNLGIDPMLQDALHVALGAAVIPMFAKGKYADTLNTFGASIAGEALLNIVNGYLPADYQVSGVDNSNYALGMPYVKGPDNGNYALGNVAGTFPERASGSIPASMRVAG